MAMWGNSRHSAGAVKVFARIPAIGFKERDVSNG